MQEWYTEEYAAEQERQYEALKAEFPELVTKRLECNQGWFPILRGFFAEVRRVIPDGHEAAFSLRQVKEKFAGLRIYYGLDDDLPDAAKAAIRGAYRVASDAADVTCEVCGRPGVLRVRNGWFATRCEEHADGGVPVPPEGI